MIRRPPRSTLDRSSAASDVYKRQDINNVFVSGESAGGFVALATAFTDQASEKHPACFAIAAVSYTHLRAHETVLDLVCRLLLEKKKKKTYKQKKTKKKNKQTKKKKKQIRRR